MRSNRSKARLVPLVLGAVLMLGLAAAPQAAAQPPYNQGAVVSNQQTLTAAQLCASSASDGTLSGSGTSYVVTLPPNASDCASNAVVGHTSTPTIDYDGPAVSGLALPVELGTCGVHTITLTLTLKAGGTKVQTWNPNSNLPGCVPTAVPAVAGPAAVAFTGSDVSMPLIVGFSMIGAGGLALLGANKRRRTSEGATD